MGAEMRSPIMQFVHYLGEGVHYLGDDLKGALVALLGRGKVADLPVLPPEALMQRIDDLQLALQEQKIESGEYERQLKLLKQLVKVSQRQQRQIAADLSKLSDVLHRQ